MPAASDASAWSGVGVAAALRAGADRGVTKTDDVQAHADTQSPNQQRAEHADHSFDVRADEGRQPSGNREEQRAEKQEQAEYREDRHFVQLAILLRMLGSVRPDD